MLLRRITQFVASRVADVPLTVILIVGAALRIPTLSVQSYWSDEGYTVHLVRLGFVRMLRTIPVTESTPPVYYVAAWTWARIFGSHEFGLRLLSALAGVALIYVTYRLGAYAFSRPAGLVAAVLIAVNPLAVWYSQEARSYAFFALFSATGLLLLLRALETPTPRRVAVWSVVSGLCLATHYFAIYILLPQAVWLVGSVWRRRGRESIRLRSLALAASPVVLVGAALVPLLLDQRNRGYGFRSNPLYKRIAQVPEQFLVGYGVWYTNWGKLAAVASALIVAVAIGGLVLRRRRLAQSFRVLASILVVAFATPVVVAAARSRLDYVLTLYFIALLVPTTVLVAEGLARSRSKALGAAVLAIVGTALVVVVFVNPNFQRTNLRGLAQAITHEHHSPSRAIVLTPSDVLGVYVPRLESMPSRGRMVREIDIVGLASKKIGQAWTNSRVPQHALQIEGFVQVERLDAPHFTLIRFRSKRPVAVTRSDLARSHLGDYFGSDVSVYFQPADRSGAGAR